MSGRERCWAAARNPDGPRFWRQEDPLADRCPNEARYSSGLCGVHDITHNGGAGHRLSRVNADSAEAVAARQEALDAIHCERLRQIKLWGPGPMPPGWELKILAEEVGEVATALMGEGNVDVELTQVAAVCVRWLEERSQLRKDRTDG